MLTVCKIDRVDKLDINVLYYNHVQTERAVTSWFACVRAGHFCNWKTLSAPLSTWILDFSGKVNRRGRTEEGSNLSFIRRILGTLVSVHNPAGSMLTPNR